MVFTSERKRIIVESYFRNSVFNNGHTVCLVSAKFSKFKLKQVYATKNTCMRPDLQHLESRSQRLL
jgi:hypothetical protein